MAARDWIASEMQGFAASSGGRMSVEVQTFVQQPDSALPVATNISNVVATLTGATDPDRIYVVTGHYDSRVSDVTNFQSIDPGADDDASGVAIMMEMARIMATRQVPATMVFAAVSGEEQGLFGSTFLANSMAQMDVQGMFTNDIVGSSTAEDGTKDPFNIRLFAQGTSSSESAAVQSVVATIGGENDSPARELARFVASVAQNAVTQMNVNIIYRTERFLRGGDHIPFLNNGFPAARFTEPHEDFRHQHQDIRIEDEQQFGDLIEFVDFDFTARVGRVNLAAMFSLASGPSTPKNVLMDTTVLTNNSTLTWTTGNDPLVASYEVLWRSTSDTFWTNVINVGNVDTATVLQSKDNVVLGVRAVGTNGMRSPAAFPFPDGGD